MVLVLRVTSNEISFFSFFYIGRKQLVLNRYDQLEELVVVRRVRHEVIEFIFCDCTFVLCTVVSCVFKRSFEMILVEGKKNLGG